MTGLQTRCHGFTLTELLVVIVVLGLLVCLQFANRLGSTRELKRAQCGVNLRQFNLALQIYGNENNSRLPISNVGYWPWDVSWSVGSYVESTGCKWQVMYCPGRAPHYSQTDDWQFYNYVPNSVRVLGYAHTLPGTGTLIQTNVNATLLPEPIQVAPLVYARPRPAERVLLADATISGQGQYNPALRYSDTYNYNWIQGGYAKPHASAHLSGRFPAGGNLGMLDGHVEWRSFDQMYCRVASGTPGFWW